MKKILGRFNFYVCSASVLVLAACTPASQSGSSQMAPPTSLAAVDEVTAHPLTSLDREGLDREGENKDSSANVSVDQKLRALENRVHFLESQMNAAQPTLNKVEAMDQHFQQLSSDLQTIRGGGVVPVKPYLTKGTWVEAGSGKVKETKKTSPKLDAAKKEPAKKGPVKKELVKQDGKVKPADRDSAAKNPPDNAKKAESAVTGVRIGPQKNGATRIVLDTTQPSAIHYDLDNGEKILVIDLPKNNWKSDADKMIKGGAGDTLLVSSYHASEDENGAHLILKLKDASKVTATARLSPSGGYGHRVYIDVMPLK
ncbi:MAG: hypothetical protein JNK24_06075 [Alphaproteobacteria bacterium]|nr:hypothetical protein [Alphaproteobacteria bacterium]